VTQYNPLQVAPGALIKADNCVVSRENILENRRGYATYSTLGANIKQLLNYSGKIIAHHGTTLSYDNGSGTFAPYSGSYTEPTGTKIRGLQAYSNLYFTTDKGVQVVSDVTGTAARFAGAPRSLDGSYSLTGASGFLSDTRQCAYRFVIQRTDANGNIINGYPSTRMWVVNSAGGSRNVAITLYIPSEVTTADVVQVYRTAQVSFTSNDAAGDEMGLVYQINPTASDISNKYMTFTDSITDELRGATLYTSPSQEGIGQANDRPPLCKDIALYKSDYMFYANTSTKQRLFITLVGTSGLSGKAVVIGGQNYYFGATEVLTGVSAPQVAVGATGIAAADIDTTARSLVRVINRYASNTSVYAYYLSGPNDLPGQILIEERGIGATAFTVTSSDTTIAGMFFPPPPVAPTTNAKSTSSNSVQKNYIYYSKAQQPEAVPAFNYIPVGPANKAILRIVALRESLIIIKEDGVYRLTGEAAPFSVVPLDLTADCKSADSVAALNNMVYMLGSDGVVAVSDTGTQVVSREIELSLRPVLTFSNVSTLSVGQSYDSEHLYLLALPENSSDTGATQTYVYNTFTRLWTRWTYAFKAATIETDADKLFFAKPSSAVVYAERKTFTDNDFADPEYDISMSNITGRVVTFTITGPAPEEGWVIAKAGTEIAIEDLVPLPSSVYQATMANDIPDAWTVGVAKIYPSVGMDVMWDAWYGGAPSLMKQVSEFAILSDNIPGANSATRIKATFKTNIDEETEEVDISIAGAGWGGSWGSIPWGGGGDSYGYRTWSPRNKQIGRIYNFGVKHVNAREKLSCAGFACQFKSFSGRIGR
jgi:hypothetical protein